MWKCCSVIRLAGMNHIKRDYHTCPGLTGGCLGLKTGGGAEEAPYHLPMHLCAVQNRSQRGWLVGFSTRTSSSLVEHMCAFSAPAPAPVPGRRSRHRNLRIGVAMIWFLVHGTGNRCKPLKATGGDWQDISKGSFRALPRQLQPRGSACKGTHAHTPTFVRFIAPKFFARSKFRRCAGDHTEQTIRNFLLRSSPFCGRKVYREHPTALSL